VVVTVADGQPADHHVRVADGLHLVDVVSVNGRVKNAVKTNNKLLLVFNDVDTRKN
jgi:hypothetical protein